MMYSKEADKRYKAKLKSVSIRINPETYDRWMAGIERTGSTLRRFLIDAVEEKLERTQNS